MSFSGREYTEAVRSIEPLVRCSISFEPSGALADPTRCAVERLRQLSQLHREGALSDEEFSEKKAALLKRI